MWRCRGSRRDRWGTTILHRPLKVVTLACLSVLQPISAQGAPSAAALTAAIDRYFAPLVANHDFAGTVLVARGGQALVHKAYGLADPELEVPSSTNGKYRIASLTKTFTAAAIVMMEAQGKLRLTDTLSRFLPEFPGSNGITLLQLLRHESGLANPDYLEAFRDRITLVELVRRIGARPPLFAPGAENRYSNAGYNVLARVIEVASGLEYNDYLRQQIFLPLGMRDTGVFPDDSLVVGRVRGFLPGPEPSGVIPAPWSDGGFDLGSGSLRSTTGDLAKWAAAVHHETLYHRSALAYPYGWGRLGQDRRQGLSQTGLSIGFTANLDLWFADSLYVVVLGNVENGHWSAWGGDLATLARGGEVASTARRERMALSASDAARFVGQYATAENQVEIRYTHGGLWLYLNNWPVPKHLAPVGRGAFEVRGDFGRIEFDTGGAGPAVKLDWVFGPESRTAYPRQSGG